jgi:tetratricopeptide (TPR) repeat protein/serine/threonine protein kinase
MTEETLFSHAAELPPEQRAAYLDQACAGDAALRARLDRLLGLHDAPGSFLVAPAAEDLAGIDLDVTIPHVPLALHEMNANERAGERIGRYKLLQEIGEGGFGTVWMSEQVEPVTRRVALKIIKLGMDTREVIARFEAERQALAMMDHPNIAKVLDAGATDRGRPFFVMELVKGMTITHYCDEAGLGTRERLALFGDVCSAINHAHQKGIIHRDIKPSNVMVSLYADQPVAKVIDFGIAKATQCKLTDKTLFTRFEQFIGTPVYMSPEQAGLRGVDIDTRSDIHALGVLLYELLVGKPPFDGKSLLSAGYEEMRRIIREVEPLKPSSRLCTLVGAERTSLAKARQIDEAKLNRLVEPELDWIVMKAIEKDRTRRYETANAFAQDIVRYLTDEPVSAGPPSVTYRMRKFARRNQRGLLSGAAAAAALLAGLAVAGGIWLDSTFEKQERVTRALDLIGQAERRLERNAAADIDDDRHFREAREVERRVEESLSGIKSLDDGVRQRRESLQQAVASEERARKLVAAIEGGVTKAISYLESAKTDAPAKARTLAAAFAEFGIPPFDRSADETVARITAERESLRDRILAGLEEWSDALEETNPEQAARLEDIIGRADTDPWRRELRQSIKSGDAAALAALAEREEIAEQPTLTVLQLSSALEERQLAGAMETLLRRAQREAPASYWTNFILGSTLMGAIDREQGEDIRVKYLSIVGSSFGSDLAGALPKQNPERPEFAEAIGFLRAAAAARPDATTPWVMLGIALSGSGHLDEAVASYRRAFALDPEEEAMDFLLGNALLAQGRQKEALSHLRREAEKNPAGDGLEHFQFGTTLAQLGEYEEARAVLLHYFKRQSEKSHAPASAEDPATGQRRDKFTFMGKETAPTEEHAHLYLALAQSGRGDSKEALVSAQLALDFNPNSAGAHTLRGMELVKTGETDAAEQALKKAIELDPGLAAAHNFLAMALIGKNDSEAAIAMLRRSIELDPKDASAHCTLAGLLGELGKLDEANASIKTALELAPEFALAWNNLAAIREREGKQDEAIEHFRKAASLDPGNTTPARRNLAKTLFKAGKHEEAIAVYHQLDDASAYVQLAGWFEKQERIAEAIEVLERAIALKPDLAAAHHDLGVMVLKSGRTRDAFQSLRTAVRLAPGLASARNILGLALLTNGDYEESIDSIIEAIQLEPGSEPFKNALLAALLSSGRITAAGLAHGSCDDAGCVLTLLLEKDQQLREILEKDGPEAAGLPALLNDIYELFSRSSYVAAVPRPYSDAELRAVWDGRREEIDKRLASATLRQIQIRKQSDKHPGATEEELRAIAADVLQKLIEGGDFATLAEQHSDGWAEGKTETVAYGELAADLNAAAFSLGEGGFTRKVIEDEHAFYLLKVESRQAGKVEAFDDPKAQEAIKAVLAAQSRGDWERRYLAYLQDKKPDRVMARMQNMAAAYLMAAGDFSKAEKLLEQAFAMQLAELGTEDPKTLNTMGNLAICRLQLGQAEEAMKMLVELLAIRRKVLGPEHPDTLLAMGNLAHCHFQAGRREDAIQLQEQRLTLSRKVSGPEHSQTLAAMSVLGRCYFEVGRQEDALKLKTESEAIRSKVSGQRQDPKPAAPTTLPAPSPGSAVAALKDGALQAWSGKDAEHDATRRRMLAGAAATTNADVAERVAKLACLRPIADAKTQEAALTLARKALELARASGEAGPWQQMTLGMAEYRGGRFQEADFALNAVAGMMNPKTYRPGVIQGTADCYRSMSLFHQGRKDEARALVAATEAKMKPFPADEQNPLARADHDDLILWLACREAKALLSPKENLNSPDNP